MIRKFRAGKLNHESTKERKREKHKLNHENTKERKHEKDEEGQSKHFASVSFAFSFFRAFVIGFVERHITQSV